MKRTYTAKIVAILAIFGLVIVMIGPFMLLKMASN